MNRRNFFSRLLGGAAAFVGLKARGPDRSMAAFAENSRLAVDDMAALSCDGQRLVPGPSFHMDLSQPGDVSGVWTVHAVSADQ